MVVVQYLGVWNIFTLLEPYRTESSRFLYFVRCWHIFLVKRKVKVHIGVLHVGTGEPSCEERVFLPVVWFG